MTDEYIHGIREGLKVIYKSLYKDAYYIPKDELEDTCKHIYNLKNELTDHLTETFGIAPEQTTLRLHSMNSWIDYLSATGRLLFFPSYLGLYNSDLTAHVWLCDPEQAVQTFFHEYFGHGLYVEHTPQGQRLLYLQSLCKKSSDLESPESKRIWRELCCLKKRTEKQDEGFAQWMQWYLSKQTRRTEEFERLISRAENVEYKKSGKKFIEYSKEKGEHALMRKCGFTIKK